jgi:precorrin-6B methylase 2
MVDRIVIGGTGGKFPEILEICRQKLVAGGILVINCLLLESLASALSLLKKLAFVSPEVLSVNIARGAALGGQTMLRPLNPVFIVSAERG